MTGLKGFLLRWRARSGIICAGLAALFVVFIGNWQFGHLRFASARMNTLVFLLALLLPLVSVAFVPCIKHAWMRFTGFAFFALALQISLFLFVLTVLSNGTSLLTDQDVT